jgi:hypothetical protein
MYSVGTYSAGFGGDFVEVGPVSTLNFANEVSQMFTAVTVNGGSTVSGTVGTVSLDNSKCIVSGYITGK